MSRSGEQLKESVGSYATGKKARVPWWLWLLLGLVLLGLGGLLLAALGDDDEEDLAVPPTEEPTGAEAPAATAPPSSAPAGGEAPPAAAPAEGDEVLRLAGPNRIATAVSVSSANFGAGEAEAVVLARADVFADALAGTPLTAAKNAPLLLSESNSLSDAALGEVRRVLPEGRPVHLLGGPAALAPSIEARLAEAGYEVTRYAGADRYATAVAIADGLGTPEAVFLANGTDFPDALSAGPAAANARGAILLTAGTELPPATAAYLQAHSPEARWAIGGAAATAAPSGFEAIAGADRYATSALVAAEFFPSPPVVGVATGVNFPDALAGAASISRERGPLLLTAPERLPEPVRAYLDAHEASVDDARVYGGPQVVSQDVEAALARIVEGS